MLNSVSNTSPISFNGKTFSKKDLKFAKDVSSKHYSKGMSEAYKAYSNVGSHPCLEKDYFGYKVSRISNALKPYKGLRARNTGFSTEAGGYGGGWVKSDVSTPLSTKDVHDCAVLNLINENNGTQMMYHVYAKSNMSTIKNFISQEFPRFTKANILPGDQFKTNTTVNNILDAVDMLNPSVKKRFYHLPIDNPEVVAINGELQYIDNTEPNKMTFKEITNQYIY